MIRSLYTAASGMDVQQTNLDTISNNLANVNTTGFKKVRSEFQDLLYQTISAPGSDTTNTTETPSGIQVGLGAKLVATNRVFGQGSLRNTGRALDMAVMGRGFFQVTLPNGNTAYTRDGSFTLDQNGQMVTSSGYLLDPNITIPQEALSVFVGTDGSVSVDIGDNEPQNVGQIQLATFINPSGLKALGGNVFQASNASGDAQVGNPGDLGVGEIQSNFLEISNVSVAEEMINMIIGQRAFEATSRSVRTADQVLTEITNLKR
ncbi:MAG: flagellar basal-body rod protein FlgG [Acidobacteriota bacterium]|nr:flagellar basal-body rod protein FlgG [Acidobacteriota bacterium]